jgi:hypothetical protein
MEEATEGFKKAEVEAKADSAIQIGVANKRVAMNICDPFVFLGRSPSPLSERSIYYLTL